MNNPMYKVIYFCFMLCAVLLCSCSSDIKEIKPGTHTVSPTDNSIKQPVRETAELQDSFFNRYRKLEFPVDDYYWIICSWQRWGITTILLECLFYKKIYGVLPEDIDTLVQSEFLLFWPRNLMTGQPVKLIKSRDLVENESDLASFKYHKIDSTMCGIDYLDLESETYHESDSKVWRIRSFEKSADPNSAFSRLAVSGGTDRLNGIEDLKTKELVALCANLDRMLSSHAAMYYSNYETLPRSIEDILFNSNFLIRENFEALKSRISEPGVNFAWGYDYSKKAFYRFLDIDGIRYIEFRGDYGKEGSLPDIGFPLTGPPYDLTDLDMSTPFISSSNIGALEIPDAYFISIANIPLNE
jgi:hypothetical protein